MMNTLTQQLILSIQINNRLKEISIYESKKDYMSLPRNSKEHLLLVSDDVTIFLLYELLVLK